MRYYGPEAPRPTFRHVFDPSLYPREYLLAGWDEEQTQRMVVARLRALRIEVVEIDAGLRRVRAVLRQRGAGGLPAAGLRGLVDLIGCSSTGRAVFLEVKRPACIDPDRPRRNRPAGKPTPDQLRFLDRFHRAGAIVGVTWGPADLDDIIKPWPLGGV